MEDCVYCEPHTPTGQLYETKLFRVVVVRHSLAMGHVKIVRKSHDPHFYSFSPDDIDDLEYLLKKVSFWVMRLTNSAGFTMLMNDGTQEVGPTDHLEIHIIPRRQNDSAGTMIQQLQTTVTQLDDATMLQTVTELQRLMQLPQ